MESSISNDICINRLPGNTELSEAHQRVLPFMNPKIKFNDKTKSYNYDDRSCSLPIKTLPHFRIDKNCSYGGMILDVQEDTTYPHGCGVTVNNVSTIDTLRDNLDEYYLNRIKRLKYILGKKQEEKRALEKECNIKLQFKLALQAGRWYGRHLIKTWDELKTHYSDVAVQNSFVKNRDHYHHLAKVYNDHHTKLNDLIFICNRDLEFCLIFEECNFGGQCRRIPLNTLGERNFSLPSDFKLKTGSIKVLPGLILWLYGHNGAKWVQNHIGGLRNMRHWGYNGTCLNEFINFVVTGGKVMRNDNEPRRLYTMSQAEFDDVLGRQFIGPPVKVTRGNNGTVSCDTYCAGTDRLPWNNELPKEWDGATCERAFLGGDGSDIACDKVMGLISKGVACECTKSGGGWKLGPSEKRTQGNNGTVSCNTYCAGSGGHPWNNELPKEWNGATCKRAFVGGTGEDIGCDKVMGLISQGVACDCIKSGGGWY
jgi:hypothetical protein